MYVALYISYCFHIVSGAYFHNDFLSVLEFSRYIHLMIVKDYSCSSMLAKAMEMLQC